VCSIADAGHPIPIRRKNSLAMRLHVLITAWILALCLSGCGHNSPRAAELASRKVLSAIGASPRWIELDGCRVRFVENRALQGDPVPWLLVHGIGGSLEDFGPLLAQASKQASFIAFDLPGFGDSSNPAKDFHISTYVHVLRSLLDALQLPRAHLVCHSMGGQICLAFALDNAQRVQTLTLIDAAGGYATDPWLVKTAKTHAGLNLMRADSDNAPLLSLLSDERLLVFRRVLTDDPMALAGLASFTANLRHRLRELDLPVLIVWGTDDPIFPVEEAFNLKENISGSRLRLVEGGDHQPFASRPDLVLKWITEHHRRPVLTGAAADTFH
jgi:pimeloyl-ACP methyl ester carboxylesterase